MAPAARPKVVEKPVEPAKKASAPAKAKAATVDNAKPAPVVNEKPATVQFNINVGLFADDNNARNAYTKLVDAGLPAQSTELKTSKGKRTRVRVGPFDTEAEAERAADKIKGLGLEAQTVRQ